MNFKFIIILAISAACLLTGCSVDSQQKIDSRYKTETVNITKVNKVDGISFYVPDSYYEDCVETVSDKSFKMISDDKYIEAVKVHIDLSNEDHKIMSDELSAVLSVKTEVITKIEENTWKASFELINGNKEGLVKVTDDHVIAAASDDSSVNEMIVNSLKSYKDRSSVTVTVEDPELSAKINGLSIGMAADISDIKDDFSAMGANFDSLQEDLNNINGKTISDINKNVVLQFSCISDKGETAHGAYLDSVYAYRNAVGEYNVSLSNGIDLMSTKADIERAMGFSFEGDWEQIVIENSSKESNIRSMIINYNNERDEIESIIINGSEKVNTGDREELSDESESSDASETVSSEDSRSYTETSSALEDDPELGLMGKK